MRDVLEYRDFEITPDTAHPGYFWAHKNYDGPEDGRCGHEATVSECMREIELWWEARGGDDAKALGGPWTAGRYHAPTRLHIVFDGPPGHDGGRFVEVETPDGKSVRAGEWHERTDGLWELRLSGTFLPVDALADARKAVV